MILFVVEDIPPIASKFTNNELKLIKAFTIPMIYIDTLNLSVQAKPKNKNAQTKFPG